MSKKVLTIVIETEGAEDCRWIWDSHKQHILGKGAENDAVRHGVVVVNMDEGDALSRLRKAEEELRDQQEYVEQLEIANSTLMILTEESEEQ